MTHQEHLKSLKQSHASLRSAVISAIKIAISHGLKLSVDQKVTYTNEAEDCFFIVTNLVSHSDAVTLSGYIASTEKYVTGVSINAVDTDSLLHIYASLLEAPPAGVFRPTSFADVVEHLTGTTDAFYLKHIAGPTGFSGIIGPFTRQDAPPFPVHLDGSRVIEYRLSSSLEWKKIDY